MSNHAVVNQLDSPRPAAESRRHFASDSSRPRGRVWPNAGHPRSGGLEHILRGMYPSTCRRKLLSVVIAYFDESGAHGGPDDVFTLAGLVARDERWTRVEGFWDRQLKRRTFHMTDFENRKGEFVGWPSPKNRILLIASLADSLRGNITYAVAHSVIYKDFGEVFCPNLNHKKTLRFAHGVLLLSCLADIIRALLPALQSGGTISFVFEEREGVEGHATDRFHEFKRNGGLEGFFGTIAFRPKQSFRGLQAADMLAYENFKFVTQRFAKNDGNPIRKLFIALRDSRRLEAGYYNKDALLKLKTRLTGLGLWPPQDL
jgi:uncharacterized protein DUF3800